MKARIMNKGFPIALALATSLIAAPLSGQTMLGFRGGASIAYLSGNDETGAKNRVGFATSAYVGGDANRTFLIQAGAAIPVG